MSLFDNIFKITTKWIIKHSVELAMGGAAIGVGLTVYTTTKSTLKVAKIVHNEELTKKEKVKQSIVPCLPTAASVIFTLTAIGGMYWLGRKKQAALFALLMSTTNAFQQYRNNTAKRIGKEAEMKEYTNAVHQASGTEVPHGMKFERGEVPICDSVTGQWRAGSIEDFWKSAYAINEAYHEYGMVGFNQWLYMLGYDEEDEIDDFGWTYEGGQYYGYSNIEVNLAKYIATDGTEYYLIVYLTLPHSMFLYPYDKGVADEDCTLIPLYDTELWRMTSQEEKDRMIQHEVDALRPRK
jgi:hypothetical protein